MNETEKNLLINGIKKFKDGEYSESDFHATLETVISMITESHLIKLRQELEAIEGQLERIDFSSNQTRKDYLAQIKRIEEILII